MEMFQVFVTTFSKSSAAELMYMGKGLAILWKLSSSVLLLANEIFCHSFFQICLAYALTCFNMWERVYKLPILTRIDLIYLSEVFYIPCCAALVVIILAHLFLFTILGLYI